MAEANPVKATPVSPQVNIFTTVQFWMFISGVLGVALVVVIISLYVIPPTGSKDNNNGATPSVTSPVTESPTSTPTVTATPKPDQNIQTSNANVMEFTSEELGITFKYAKKYATHAVAIKREGNKVYVYDTTMNYKTGQYVEVFTKQGSVSMEDDMKIRFLAGYSATNCFVTTYNHAFPAGYEGKKISTPAATDLEDMDNKLKLCPATYTASNGISYFEGSNVRDDKYVFLSIGQYAIGGDTAQNAWQDTLRFIAK